MTITRVTLPIQTPDIMALMICNRNLERLIKFERNIKTKNKLKRIQKENTLIIKQYWNEWNKNQSGNTLEEINQS